MTYELMTDITHWCTIPSVQQFLYLKRCKVCVCLQLE